MAYQYHIPKNYEGIATDSNGALGGIGTLWNKWNWKIISQKLNNSWVRGRSTGISIWLGRGVRRWGGHLQEVQRD